MERRVQRFSLLSIGARSRERAAGGGRREALCLELGGTNERTSGRAELLRSRCTAIGGVRGCAYGDAGAWDYASTAAFGRTGVFGDAGLWKCRVQGAGKCGRWRGVWCWAMAMAMIIAVFKKT